MSSEVKLIVQSDVDVNLQNRTFIETLLTDILRGKRSCFRVNIDPDDINYTNYNNADDLQVDLGEGEIKYVLQIVENSRAKLENEEKKLKEIEETRKIIPSGNKPPLTLTLTIAVDRKNFVNNLQPQISQEIKVGQISNRH